MMAFVCVDSNRRYFIPERGFLRKVDLSRDRDGTRSRKMKM